VLLGLATLVLALSMPATPTAEGTGQPVGIREVTGVWMLCYDPALNMGAHELDKAYLMLQPDGRYFEQSDAAIDNPVSSRLGEFGRFKRTPSGIEVSPEGLLGWDGRLEPGTHLRPRPLVYRAKARVVLFNDLHRPLVLPVLCPGESLNWCYAKVF
jgi:hypothetical protein